MTVAPGPELYVAILINEVVVDGPGHVPHFEESIVLVRARSEADAERVAQDYARSAETSYLNVDGETVRWNFRELATVGLALADDLPMRVDSGVEIFSRFFDDLEAYREVGGSPDAGWTSLLLRDRARGGSPPTTGGFMPSSRTALSNSRGSPAPPRRGRRSGRRGSPGGVVSRR